MSNKKKAVAIAVVRTIVELTSSSVCNKEQSPWNQQGRQAIMTNRNNMQMRYIKSK